MTGCGLQAHRLAQKRRRICPGNRYAKGGLLRFGLVHCAPVALAADAMLRIALNGDADVFRRLPENLIILFAVPSVYEMSFSIYSALHPVPVLSRVNSFAAAYGP